MPTPNNSKPETLAPKVPSYDELLAQLVIAAEQSEGLAKTPQELAALRLKVHQDIHTARRKAAHEKAKSSQPKMMTAHYPEDVADLLKYLRSPLTLDEQTPGGLDQFALTIKECESSGNVSDILYALARFYRKAWGENHWGDITAVVKG